MANRRQLVKRRRTVRNIRKITRTMQLIATARFQKSLSRATATKPYAQKLAAMVDAASKAATGTDLKLLSENEAEKSALFVITSNRGLCGGYNGNVLRLAMNVLHEQRDSGQQIDLYAAGKKGIAYLKFLGEELTAAVRDIDDQPRFDQVSALADQMMAAFMSGDYASVHVCYMRFISAGQQRPTVMQLLPLVREADESADESASEDETTFDYVPTAEELLHELLPSTVRMKLFQCFNDAAVSEQVARMVAMKAATDAAGDMIKVLTQQYNRARQTSITMELLDIIGGAAAIS